MAPTFPKVIAELAERSPIIAPAGFLAPEGQKPEEAP